MVDETSDVGVFTRMPTIEDVSTELKATPDVVQNQLSDFLVQAATDLISGKNPAQSKTLWFNGILVLVGIGGSLYTILISGNTAAAAPFIISTVTGAVNSFLRCITTGPVMTDGMNKILEAFGAITPQQK
jgi:hypothetical protein